MTAATVEYTDILWIGEDGQWLLAEGHVDLASFTAAADKAYAETVGSGSDPVDELPSAEFDAMHSYWRPATREDCEEAHAYLKDRPEVDYEAAIDAAWKSWQAEDYRMFESKPGLTTEPMTYIGTGA